MIIAIIAVILYALVGELVGQRFEKVTGVTNPWYLYAVRALWPIVVFQVVLAVINEREYK